MFWSIFTPEDVQALQSCVYPAAAVVILCLLDILSGLTKAAINHNVNSSKMREGLGHKAAYFYLFVLFALIQIIQIHFNFWADFPTAAVVAGLICICETISVIENVCEINPAIAQLPLIKELMEYGKEVTNG